MAGFGNKWVNLSELIDLLNFTNAEQGTPTHSWTFHD